MIRFLLDSNLAMTMMKHFCISENRCESGEGELNMFVLLYQVQSVVR